MRRLCPNRETRGTGVNLGQSVFVLSQCSSSNTSNRAPIAYTSAFMGVAMIVEQNDQCKLNPLITARISTDLMNRECAAVKECNGPSTFSRQ